MSNKDKLAVIFGGSGFIGRHLTSRLIEQGFQVQIADLSPPDRTDIIFAKCDVRGKIKMTIHQIPDLVINLAAVHRTPGHAADEYYETNVAGATHVVDWCNTVGAKKIVFTSSISVYGPGSESKNELSPLKPIHAYGKSKILSENIFRSWQQEKPSVRTVVICRPAVIFGPGEHGNFTRLAKALKRHMFFYPGGPDTVKSCGYVMDLVRSMLFVADCTDGAEVTYNFCYPESHSIGQICETFRDVAGYSKPISLPIAKIGNLLTHFPNPVSILGIRVLKLVVATKVSPSVLLHMGFVWETDLKSAFSDWKVKSERSGYFE